MDLIFNLTLAQRAIRTNRLRSVLTIVIIGLGIGALVGILTATDVLEQKISSSFGSMGANTFQITSDVLKRGRRKGKVTITTSEGKNISYDEAEMFKKRFSFPGSVGVSMTGTGIATARYGSEKTNPNVRTVGIDENYFTITDSKLEVGRSFSANEIQSGTYNCVIGIDVAKKLFKSDFKKALNKTISVGDYKYTVIGIMASKGGSMMMNADNVVMMPLINARTVYGADQSYVITVAVKDVKAKALAAEEAEGLFRSIRKLPLGVENNFTINQNDELVANLLENIGYVSIAAIAIGIITVLGSVIGLMNIMLVSVAERTREIGISKALGARSSTIKSQFLTESIIISMLGGIFGVVLGMLFGFLVAFLLSGSFIIPWAWIGMAITLCAIVGIASGIYPAIKASRLDPIVALRYE